MTRLSIAVLTEDSSSDTLPQWDSLRHMNLVLALEDEFGVSIPDEEAVVCGMALGYEDVTKPENTLRTERAPLAEWVKFLD